MVESIIKSFDIWTDAQGVKSKGRVQSIDNISLAGIAHLRDLILELAIRGKLVPQDLNDEPASELLQRIESEKQLLIKSGIAIKPGFSSEVFDQEKPFTLPKGWKWIRIRDVGYDWGQKTPVEDFSYIDISTIDNLKGTLISPTILNAKEAPSRARKIVKRGTVIYSTVRPYLKNISVISEDYLPSPIASTAFAVIHPYLDMPGEFLVFYLGSPTFVKYVEGVQMGIAYPAINDKHFFSGLMPLPPLAEQHRIVDKVKELMTLCDELEKEKTSSLKTHQTLVAALLQTLTAANDAGEVESAWHRLVPHFDMLFCTEDSIDQLKQTILQLAIMGRLVKQDSADEPASELLRKIEREKEKLVKEGKIKKEKPLPEIKDDEKPFALPKGWEFVRLSDLCELITKGSSPKWQGVSYVDNENEVLFITSENVGSFKMLLENRKYVEKKFNEVEPRSILKQGDFLMNIVGGSIGRTAIYNLPDLANINQAVCLIRAFIQHLQAKYLLYFFNSEVCISYMFDKQVDNARANLSMGNISRFVIPIPPLEEQKRIVKKIEKMYSICDDMASKVLKSGEIKSLLSKVIVQYAVSQKKIPM
jgi:type I restriction enzyme S subunit